MVSATKLKLEFLRLLTEDSPHHDARRKNFNQAIFDAEKGFAVFNGTDLEMVMEKFNKAIANLTRSHIYCIVKILLFYFFIKSYT